MSLEKHQKRRKLIIISFTAAVLVVLLSSVATIILVLQPLKFGVFPPVAECTDDDLGLDIDTFGVCRTGKQTIEDHCIVPRGGLETLQVESYCLGNKCLTETSPCPPGTRCNGGVCVPTFVAEKTYPAETQFTGINCFLELPETRCKSADACIDERNRICRLSS